MNLAAATCAAVNPPGGAFSTTATVRMPPSSSIPDDADANENETDGPPPPPPEPQALARQSNESEPKARRVDPPIACVLPRRGQEPPRTEGPPGAGLEDAPSP